MIYPNEFSIVANRILNELGKEEAYIRTYIGRKYYYLFLELREGIKSKISNDYLFYLNEEENININLHSLLKNFLFNLSRSDGLSRESRKILRIGAQSFRSLRKLRNVSDYKIYSTIALSIKDINKQIENIEEVVKEIENIDKKILNDTFRLTIQNK